MRSQVSSLQQNGLKFGIANLRGQLLTVVDLKSFLGAGSAAAERQARVLVVASDCRLDATGERLVRDAIDRGGMSARGVHRALRVARTIADLGGRERVDTQALAEALQYRAYEGRRTVVT